MSCESLAESESEEEEVEVYLPERCLRLGLVSLLSEDSEELLDRRRLCGFFRVSRLRVLPFLDFMDWQCRDLCFGLEGEKSLPDSVSSDELGDR